MLARRWIIACAKHTIAARAFCRYDPDLSRGGHRRFSHTGEEKCIKNSSLSRWLPLFWQDVTHSAKALVLVPELAQRALCWLAAIPSRVLLSVPVQDTPAIKALFAGNLVATALTRKFEIIEGMPSARGVPFCLSKA